MANGFEAYIEDLVSFRNVQDYLSGKTDYIRKGSVTFGSPDKKVIKEARASVRRQDHARLRAAASHIAAGLVRSQVKTDINLIYGISRFGRYKTYSTGWLLDASKLSAADGKDKPEGFMLSNKGNLLTFGDPERDKAEPLINTGKRGDYHIIGEGEPSKLSESMEITLPLQMHLGKLAFTHGIDMSDF